MSTKKTIDERLIRVMKANTEDPTSAVRDAAGIAKSDVSDRVIELACTKLREMYTSDFRASVKPVVMPSYDEKYLRKVVEDSHRDRMDRQRRTEHSRGSMAEVSKTIDVASKQARLALSIMDEWMIGDKPLRYAVRVEIESTRDADRASANGLMQNVRFYDRIIAALPSPRAVVGEHLTVKDINEFREMSYA